MNSNFDPITPRASRVTQEVGNIPERVTEEPVTRRSKSPVFYAGIGMLIVAILIIASYVGWPFIQTKIDDLQYGYPRTIQIDNFVGHEESDGTPTHFIVINLHGQVVITEIPGGSVNHAKNYLGPRIFDTGADLLVPHLSFPDLNGDGWHDLLINIGVIKFPLINSHDSFRNPKPGEIVSSV